jgi:hypothetical protein
MSVATPDLYGTADPYQRAPKSPKRPDISEERSPTDQVRAFTPSYHTSPKSIQSHREMISYFSLLYDSLFIPFVIRTPLLPFFGIWLHQIHFLFVE